MIIRSYIEIDFFAFVWLIERANVVNFFLDAVIKVLVLCLATAVVVLALLTALHSVWEHRVHQSVASLVPHVVLCERWVSHKTRDLQVIHCYATDMMAEVLVRDASWVHLDVMWEWIYFLYLVSLLVCVSEIVLLRVLKNEVCVLLIFFSFFRCFGTFCCRVLNVRVLDV